MQVRRTCLLPSHWQVDKTINEQRVSGVRDKAGLDGSLLLRSTHAVRLSPAGTILLEPLVWGGTEERLALAQERPLPLAPHPEPSITRTILLQRLSEAGIPTITVPIGNTLSGLRAAVAAGLGISAFGCKFIPPGLCILDRQALGLPELPALAFILARNRIGPNHPAQVLADLVEKNTAAMEIGRAA